MKFSVIECKKISVIYDLNVLVYKIVILLYKKKLLPYNICERFHSGYRI